VACADTPSHSRVPGNIWVRVRVSFTTGAVRSAILATAGLFVIMIMMMMLPFLYLSRCCCCCCSEPVCSGAKCRARRSRQSAVNQRLCRTLHVCWRFHACRFVCNVDCLWWQQMDTDADSLQRCVSVFIYVIYATDDQFKSTQVKSSLLNTLAAESWIDAYWKQYKNATTKSLWKHNHY